MTSQVVIVTGGIKGIGFGIAKVLVREGHKVALIYRSDQARAQEAIEELGQDNAVAIQADVTHVAGIAPMLEQVKASLGHATALVNNAGILRMGRLLDIEEATLREVMECNFFAPILLSQAFAKELIDGGRQGSITNVLSIGAYRGGNLAYCAAKAGLLNATKSMARELGKHPIRVNSVSPFGCKTELNAELCEKDPEGWDKMIKKTFLKRASEPEEVGEVVSYLISEKASYLTAIDIPVDGGYLAG